MQRYIHERKVARNARIGRVLVFGGLGAMAIGVLISLRQPYPVDLVFGLLFLGMVASQIGFPMRNRWDRKPRIDQVLDEHLKGLDQRYAVFHYALGASHVLVSPAGLFAVIARLEDGEVSFSNGRWERRLERAGLLRRRGVRQIRGIERDSEVEVERVRRYLERTLEPPQIRPLIVFLHSRAKLALAETPQLATHLKKLKSTLRKLPKAATLSQSQIDQLGTKFSLP
jgi:hypothetical protein